MRATMPRVLRIRSVGVISVSIGGWVASCLEAKAELLAEDAVAEPGCNPLGWPDSGSPLRQHPSRKRVGSRRCGGPSRQAASADASGCEHAQVGGPRRPWCPAPGGEDPPFSRTTAARCSPGTPLSPASSGGTAAISSGSSVSPIHSAVSASEGRSAV